MLPTAYAREVLGDEVELCHDTHERLAPSMTVQLAKSLEPYRLFFLEDSLPPEQSEADAFLLALLRAAAAPLTPEGVAQLPDDHFKIMRQHSTVPIAMGELFVNVQECKRKDITESRI